MKTMLLLFRTKLFLLAFLSTCTFVLANNYIQRNDFFRFSEAKDEKLIAKPENIEIKTKKATRKEMNMQLQQNSFRELGESFTATVSSDQPDYAPLSTATFTGAGFAPFENVVLKVKNLSYPCNTVLPDSSYLPWTVTADENGGFVTLWTVCNCPGDSLRLKATGQTSGSIAYAYFTDAGSFSYATSAGKANTVTLAVGANDNSTLSADVSSPQNNGSFNVSLSFATTSGTTIGIGPGTNEINLSSVTKAFVTTSGSGGGDTETFPVTVSVGSAVLPGTYNFKATANESAGSINDGGGWSFSVVVEAVGGLGGLTITAPLCAQGGSFTITYSPESGGDVTVTRTTPFSFTAKKNTEYTINTISATVNGNTYSGPTSISATTPNSNDFTETITLSYTDNTGPAVPNLSTATGECSVTVTAPTATDNCAGEIVGTTGDPLTYSTQGTFTILWSFNDGNGNISTSNQTVIVDDVTAPVLPTISTATGECSVTVTAPTATDNCSGEIVGTTGDPLTYSTQGTFTIHWSFIDGNGNISTANQTVIVDDVTAPVLPSITTATGECSVTVTAPTANDNCEGEIVGTTGDPLTYSTQGTFTIHWSFNDGNGNISTANQTVTVDDVTAPALPSIPTATGECSVTVTAPTATDNCAGEIIGTTSDPLTYSTQGTFTIHWSFNDGNGNISTANQTVIVDDVTAPVLPSITTATGECSVTVTAPTANDNCEGEIVGTTGDPLTYSTQGTFTIHWSFNDGNGNISTANQTVIVDDVTAPVLPAISTASGECSVTVTAPTATDNCAGEIIGTTSDPLTYSTQGTHTVHWSFNDGNGNISTANQTVIVADITVPSINCIAPISVNNAPGTCGAIVNYTAPVGTDNCSGAVTTQITGLASGSTFSVGETTNTFKVTDAGGNTATCSFTVTVNDIQVPTISCPSNIVLSACTPTASWSTPSATDNCPGVTIEQTAGLASGSTVANGSTTTIVYKATDASGNTSTCSFNVTRATALTASCSNTNPVLYFGFSGDQTSTIKVYPSGGTGPYTVAITMNRVMKCNVVNNSGDELWNGVGGSTVNNNCPSSGSGLTPVSTGAGIPAGGFYSVNVTLMQDAVFTATITDANGCVTTCTTSVHAEDARCFAGNSGVAKVTLCHKTGSATNPCVKICVDESAVNEHLAHGDFLGNCTPNCLPPVYTTGLGTVNNQAAAEVSVTPGIFEVKAYPNPSENQFTISVEGGTNEKVQVIVYDAVGRMVKRIEKTDNSTQIRFGEDLKVGAYFAEVRQGENRKTIKLIKQ